MKTFKGLKGFGLQGLNFTRLRVRIGLLFFILFLLFMKPGPAGCFLSGLFLVIFGLAVRAWSSGHINKQAELSTSGPYARTRNPLYVGSFFIGLGLCVSCYDGSNPLLSAVTCLLFCLGFILLYVVQISREEEFLLKKFPAEFSGYEKEVPAFMPSLKPYSRRSANRFSAALYLKNHEYRMLLAIAGMYLLLLLKKIIP